jgi:leucyl aminopeptidase
MDVSATTDVPLDTTADTIAVGVFRDEGVAHDLPGGLLSALLESGEAGRECGRLAVTHAEGRRWLLVGLGARAEFDGRRAREAAASALARATELRTGTLCWEVPHHVDSPVVAALVEGTLLRDYRFDRFKGAAETARRTPVAHLLLSAHHDVADVVGEAEVVARGQNRVRDLGNRPGNDLTPTALAEYAAGLTADRPGLSVKVLGEADIQAAGMGAFAAVAQGSAEPAKLIRLDYTGPGADERTPLLGLVGKAVTFDTGGLWLKPKLDMHEMKFDMCGGAAVIETMAVLAELRAPVRMIAVVGATENMISGRAVKPGDIVTALDGTTIEVGNTDAEGRLVLADCLTYARREGAERLVDIATLTGGVVAALGSAYAGAWSNDESLAELLLQAGTRTGERLWRLPLDDRYAEMVKGRYAQITNLPLPRVALASTAAEFLHHFAGKTPWAHIDIAGTAYDVRGGEIADKGATGFGLRLLVDLARSLR